MILCSNEQRTLWTAGFLATLILFIPWVISAGKYHVKLEKIDRYQDRYVTGSCDLWACSFQWDPWSDQATVNLVLQPENYPDILVAYQDRLSLGAAEELCQKNRTTCYFDRIRPAQYCSLIAKKMPDVTGVRTDFILTSILLGSTVVISLGGALFLRFTDWILAHPEERLPLLG